MSLTSSSGGGSSGEGALGGIREAERRLVVAQADTRRRQFEWDLARSRVKTRFRERIRKPRTVVTAFFAGLLFGALRAPELSRVSGVMSLALLLFKSRSVVREIVSIMWGPSKRARAPRRLSTRVRTHGADELLVVATQEAIRGQ